MATSRRRRAQHWLPVLVAGGFLLYGLTAGSTTPLVGFARAFGGYYAPPPPPYARPAFILLPVVLKNAALSSAYLPPPLPTATATPTPTTPPTRTATPVPTATPYGKAR
jgi:hypothetical protein